MLPDYLVLAPEGKAAPDDSTEADGEKPQPAPLQPASSEQSGAASGAGGGWPDLR